MKIKNLNLSETREMEVIELEEELIKREMFLKEEFKMNDIEASNFMSSTMNLVLALKEKWEEIKQK